MSIESERQNTYKWLHGCTRPYEQEKNYFPHWDWGEKVERLKEKRLNPEGQMIENDG